jgi:hypothetical protein
MLVRCLYASRIVGEVNEPLMTGILAQSRRNNVTAGVTGLLCFTSDVFVQVLEGGRGEVSKLLARIMTDNRHSDVTVLLYEEIAERAFNGWTMGKVNLSALNPGLVLKYSAQPRLDPFSGSGEPIMAMLMELAATGAIGA